MYAGVALKPFVNSNPHLSTEAVMPGINRSTDRARKPSAEESLAAHYNEDPLAARVLRAGLPYQIELTPSHGKPW